MLSKDIVSKIKDEWNVVYVTSTSKNITITTNNVYKGKSYQSIFNRVSDEGYSITLVVYSVTNYSGIPDWNFICSDTLENVSKNIQKETIDEANALNYISKNVNDLVGLMKRVLEYQANYIVKQDNEISERKYHYNNIIPHIKKAYQILIPKKYQGESNE